jgi:hypothetical protein
VQILLGFGSAKIFVGNFVFNNIKEYFNSSLISSIFHENSTFDGFNHKF